MIEECPYECCVSGEYQTKECQPKFECENNVCVSLCQEVIYYENVPKEVTVSYTEMVCVDVPYQEEYQEQECHDEDLSFSVSQIEKMSYFTITEGCVVQASLDVSNDETEDSGNFVVEFTFLTAGGQSITETVQRDISASATENFQAKYDKSCFEADPEISFTVLVPQKEVCETITKYRPKTRRECHDETRDIIKTIYEKVKKTKTVCEGEGTGVCQNLNCDDQEECTIDSCDEQGCHNMPKLDGIVCINGVCENGKCVESISFECGDNVCQSAEKTSCCQDCGCQEEQFCNQSTSKCQSINSNNNILDVLVIVDTSSEDASESEIKDIINMADSLLIARTGYGLRLQNIAYEGKGNKSDDQFVGEILKRYATNLPEYFMLYSFGDRRGDLGFGGYSDTYYAGIIVDDYCNEFKSGYYGSGTIYGAVVWWGGRYAQCGFDHNTKQYVSDVSLSGECSNQENTACIFKNGYYVCQNALNDRAIDPVYFHAQTFLHELMHNISDEPTNLEHYGTQECNQQSEISRNDPQYQKAEDYFNLCPPLIAKFKKTPCP